MNDLTIRDLTIGEKVFFNLKPHDKQPTCITTVTDLYEDHRGYGFVELEGVCEGNYQAAIPVYQVKKIPEDFVNLKTK